MVSISRVVVAVDGSKESVEAVHWAARLASSCRADILLVHATGLLEHLREGHGGAGRHPAAQRLLDDEWSRPLALAGIPFQTSIADGPPAEVILDTAVRTRADLIVVGSRGAGRHPAGGLGSTSAEVARRAPCPVTIVPG